MSANNPVKDLMEQGLPDCDFAVLSHGFRPHGRDYQVDLQDDISSRPGAYRLVFSHVTVVDYKTALSPKTWAESWDDRLLDWVSSQDMEGHVWGTNSSLAYPGLSILSDDADAEVWSSEIGQPMHAIRLETNRFDLRLVFHHAWIEPVSDPASPTT